MTGTGTEQDPYLVKTVNDFMSLDGKTGYAKLNNDIDFNDHPTLKYGINFVAHAGSLHFDGNKKQIRNLVFKDFNGSSNGSALEFGWMHDTYFVNMVCINCQDSMKQYPLINITKENIHNSYNMMIMSLQSNQFSTHIPRNMNECVFNFSLQGWEDKLNWEYVKITRSNINMNIDIWGTIFENAEFDTCIITGNVMNHNGNDSGTVFDEGKITNCEFRFKTLNDNLALKRYNPRAFGVNIFDNDLMKISDAQSAGIVNMKFLTSEQMKDNSYLQSIGFPVTPKIVGE